MAKYNKLAGKHIVIIGGTRGIGYGIAEACIESGARVVTIAGSSQQSADKAVSSLKSSYPPSSSSSSPTILGLGCDLSKATVERDLDALLTKAATESGEIDHIVFTAADHLTLGGLQDLTVDVALKAAHMRMLAPLMLGKVAQRHLAGAEKGPVGQVKDKSLLMTTGSIASKPAKGWSLIAYFAAGLISCMFGPLFSVSSSHTLSPLPPSTKVELRLNPKLTSPPRFSVTRNLALDLSPIRVNVVEPGAVNTSLWDAGFKSVAEREAYLNEQYKYLPVGKPAAVEEVAEAYMYLLRDSNATGECVTTRGGQHLI